MAANKRIRRSLLVLCTAMLAGVTGYALLGDHKTDIYQIATELGAKQAGLVEKELYISEHRIHYLDSLDASDKPVMLFVHGFGAFKENWIQLALQMHQDFRILSVDLPGHGKSSYSDTHNYDIDHQVKVLHTFAAEVIGKPFIMVGNSMGGAITAMYAGTYTDELQAAVLLSPGHIYDARSDLYDYLKQGIHPLIIKTEEEFAFLVDFTMEQKPFIPWPLSAVSAEKMAARYHKNQKIWTDITTDHSYDFKSVVKAIKAPTLILWGKQDRVIHYRNGEVYQSLIQSSVLHTLEGVGHAPMIEIPEKTASFIKDFIDAI